MVMVKCILVYHWSFVLYDVTFIRHYKLLINIALYSKLLIVSPKKVDKFTMKPDIDNIKTLLLYTRPKALREDDGGQDNSLKPPQDIY